MEILGKGKFREGFTPLVLDIEDVVKSRQC